MAQNNAGNSTPAGTGGDPAQTGLPGAWNIILQEAKSKGTYLAMAQGFDFGSDHMHAATSFFKELNEDIRKYNLQNGADQERGVIPDSAYEAMYNKWITAFKTSQSNNDAEAAWRAYDDGCKEFLSFNKHHNLPDDWILSSKPVEQAFGARPTDNAGNSTPAGTGGDPAQNGLPGAWNIILQEAKSKGTYLAMAQGFDIGSDHMHAATSFFKDLNEDIRKYNLQNGADQERGVIPDSAYEAMYNKWITAFKTSQSNNDAEAAWRAYDDGCKEFLSFNKHHNLPDDWILSSKPVEQAFGARPTGSGGGNLPDDSLFSSKPVEQAPPTGSGGGTLPGITKGSPVWHLIISHMKQMPYCREMISALSRIDSDMNVATKFFSQFNQQIRAYNKAEDGHFHNGGTIPEDTYKTLYGEWMAAFHKAKSENDLEAARHAFNEVTSNFQAFNEYHGLPGWTIGSGPIDEGFEPGVVPKLERNGDETLPDVPQYAESEADYSDITDLNDLEEEARNAADFSGGEVLYWWKRGVGSQAFVRYGKGRSATYRVRAGANVDYDPSSVPQVLASGALSTEPGSTSSRGRHKVRFATELGTLDEKWTYSRDDVRAIGGIGWKVDEDDEEGIEPLDLLWPEAYTIYPHTRALIIWKDGVVTLEDRSFLRRIIKGSSLQKARVIYEQARKQEIRYRKSEGLPYQHLFEENQRAADMTAEETEEEEGEEEGEGEDNVQFTNVSAQPDRGESSHPASARPPSARPPSARPPSARPSSVQPGSHPGRSGTSQVRIVEPTRQPSARPTSNRGTPRSTPKSVSRGSASQEEEIRWLREQLSMYESERRTNYQTAYKQGTGRRYNPVYDDRWSEDSEFTPPPRQRRRRVQTGHVWDNWSGRWISTRRVN
ncbi:uncharacterized protein BDW43DRAFT_317284 [Aspergillus alliaceus]|uniref:uncharacterized protein n=1 Tax=Petromyces alliaceus TaxID=209559 RepID=UPI0012A53967|nr:uncharacterized protein BDW43DRAFT_317284 [Aspergillus alliaceus]KAB8226966.1 hypothetical protein BDW43DRAFT_317284 [Aspergillus alliaceus]